MFRCSHSGKRELCLSSWFVNGRSSTDLFLKLLSTKGPAKGGETLLFLKGTHFECAYKTHHTSETTRDLLRVGIFFWHREDQ